MNEGPQQSSTKMCLRVSVVQEVDWVVGFKEGTIHHCLHRDM